MELYHYTLIALYAILAGAFLMYYYQMKNRYSILLNLYKQTKKDYTEINKHYLKYFLLYKKCRNNNTKETGELQFENEALEWACYLLSSCFTAQVQIMHKDELSCMKCPLFCNGQCKSHMLTKDEILAMYKAHVVDRKQTTTEEFINEEKELD